MRVDIPAGDPGRRPSTRVLPAFQGIKKDRGVRLPPDVLSCNLTLLMKRFSAGSVKIFEKGLCFENLSAFELTM